MTITEEGRLFKLDLPDINEFGLGCTVYSRELVDNKIPLSDKLHVVYPCKDEFDRLLIRDPSSTRFESIKFHPMGYMVVSVKVGLHWDRENYIPPMPDDEFYELHTNLEEVALVDPILRDDFRAPRYCLDDVQNHSDNNHQRHFREIHTDQDHLHALHAYSMLQPSPSTDPEKYFTLVLVRNPTWISWKQGGMYAALEGYCQLFGWKEYQNAKDFNNRIIGLPDNLRIS